MDKEENRNKGNQINDFTYSVKSSLFGVAIGDALGVPVEFKSRKTISQFPVTDMIGYGTYNLPAGTWSDDSSLTFCLAEALTQDFDAQIIGETFVKWAFENYWTARGTVFDIGNATREAITKISKGYRADTAGNNDKYSNGNGSLMRILPLIFYIYDKPIAKRFQLTETVSSITHRHIRSIISCFYYLEFARQILQGKDKFEIYKNLQTELQEFFDYLSISKDETIIFHRLFEQKIYEVKKNRIRSDGYVVHTLEASIWCLMTTENYKDAVLKAVNLGDDTDSTAAVTGGLAGLLYGFKNIPKKWIKLIAKNKEIEELSTKLGKYTNKTKLDNITEKNNYMSNMQKALFVAGILHKRGYEKLRVVPSLSPSGCSWRCSYVTEKEKGIIVSNWIYSFAENESEITESIETLANDFETKYENFLDCCKGQDDEYKKWYQGMLYQLEEEELPYAYCEYFSPTDYWKTSKGNKITTLPNEIRFYHNY